MGNTPRTSPTEASCLYCLRHGNTAISERLLKLCCGTATGEMYCVNVGFT